jgi:hypothetical protein
MNSKVNPTKTLPAELVALATAMRSASASIPKPAAQKKRVSDNPIIQRRFDMGLNQLEYWAQYGVGKSGGSRYETGGNIPRPLRILMHLSVTKVLSNKALWAAAAAVIQQEKADKAAKATAKAKTSAKKSIPAQILTTKFEPKAKA